MGGDPKEKKSTSQKVSNGLNEHLSRQLSSKRCETRVKIGNLEWKNGHSALRGCGRMLQPGSWRNL